MKEVLGKTIKMFLLWGLLYCATTVIGNIVGGITGSDEIMRWTMLAGFILLTVVYLGRHYVELSFGCIGKRRAWPAVCMAVLIAAAYVMVLVSVFVLIDIEQLSQKEFESMNETAKHLFPGMAGLLSGCIFCPVLEEIGFRGILLDGLLKSRCRPWLAILVTALIFALLHGIGVHFVVSLVFGIILGWLYWRTGSIILCMIIHVTNNSLSFIDFSGQTNVFCLIILVGSLMLLSIGLWWFAKICTNLVRG
jgi:membrane protease YdiL (CAAX protease family)